MACNPANFIFRLGRMMAGRTVVLIHDFRRLRLWQGLLPMIWKLSTPS
jgi:hypothetical protein